MCTEQSERLSCQVVGEICLGIIAARRIFFEEVHRLLVRIDLLIGIRFVEVLSGCAV